MINFPGQRPNEKVLTVVRKHKVVYIRIVITLLFAIIAPLIVFLLIWFSYYPYESNKTAGIIVGLFSSIYILYGLLFTAIGWIDEQFDLFILTNERLIDITQVNIFKRMVASTPLNQIQDTTSNIDGVIATIFNYGNIEIQTAAGNASKFEIDHVEDPANIARIILNYAQNGDINEESVVI